MACILVAGDRRRVHCPCRRLVAAASPLLRALLEAAGPGETPEVELPGLDGDTLEALVRVMTGEAALDLWSAGPEAGKLLAGARALGLLPSELSMADLL
jgi:hypothetical protein